MKGLLFFLISGWLALFSPKNEKTTNSQIDPMEALGCGPVRKMSAAEAYYYQNAATKVSVNDGNWNSGSTWSGGTVPLAGDFVQIEHHVTIPNAVNPTISGMYITPEGWLEYASGGSATLTSSENVVVGGKLSMNPAAWANKHYLYFSNVDETQYVGGGIDVLATDNGLWVMEDGILDTHGTPKVSWTRATGSIAAGATTITVDSLTGWELGDTIVIFPTSNQFITGQLRAFVQEFEKHVITNIVGNTITLDTSTAYAHPAVTPPNSPWVTWRPEIMNMSRNVRIWGTEGGKAHIFLRSTQPQDIRYISIRYMGPRRVSPLLGFGDPAIVAGRYALHFHKMFHASRTSFVWGNSMEDISSRGYVPHHSHGIVMRENNIFKIQGQGFWWDPGDRTNDIVWTDNAVGLVYYNQQAYSPAGSDTESGFIPELGFGAFEYPVGHDNISDSNVVAGMLVEDPLSAGAYDWDTNNNGVWIFRGNLAHNNQCGLTVWQAVPDYHTVENYQSYHNDFGGFHGSYVNAYRYFGNKSIHYISKWLVQAPSQHTARVRFENMTFDGGGYVDNLIEIRAGPAPGLAPTLWYADTMRGATQNAFWDNNDVIEGEDTLRKGQDLVDCVITGNITLATSANHLEVIRVRPPNGGQPYRIYKNVTGGPSFTENITDFAPPVWTDENGLTGYGLVGSYFGNPDFTDSLFSRVDHFINFDSWVDSIEEAHPTLTDENLSIKWRGQISFPRSGNIRLLFLSEDGFGIRDYHRVYLNGVLRVSEFQDSSDVFTVTAGPRYDIYIEYSNSNGFAAPIRLAWSQQPYTSIWIYHPQDEYNFFDVIPQRYLYNPYGHTMLPTYAPVEGTPPPPGPTYNRSKKRVKIKFRT